MPKIIFWNTARGSSTSSRSEAVEKIGENLVALAKEKPDLIVLAEALQSTDPP